VITRTEYCTKDIVMEEIRGMDSTTYGFSPANFLDAEEFRPTSAVFDVTGNGSVTPYSDAVNGLIQTNMNEIKNKLSSTVTLPGGWKKRLHGFLSQKNTDLLKFLGLSVKDHSTLSNGDNILRKFGTIHYSVNSTLKSVILDGSGVDIIGEINAQLLSLRKGTALEDYTSAVTFIFNEYRQAGEDTLRYESQLKDKLDVLDKIQGKLSGIVDLDKNELYSPLMEATEAYLGKMYDSYSIEESYKGFIASYRRFIALRDIVSLTRIVDTSESDPLCVICLNESVSYVLTPCGHTYCGTCIKKQYSACFLCRGIIRDRVKIYFG